MVDTVLPSNFMMTSPDSNPALAAGLSGVTPETSAPVFSGTPRLSAMSSLIDWILTPSQPRRASPNCFNWSMIATTVSDGTAKPMPIEPPVGEMMAVLMPTTSPSMLNSGPPELPLLIAASVWMKSS